MFWKKKNKSCKHIQGKTKETENNATESKAKPNRRISDGKLYDTSRAKKIRNLILSHTDIPNYNLSFSSLGGQEVVIYKGIIEVNGADWRVQCYEGDKVTILVNRNNIVQAIEALLA